MFTPHSARSVAMMFFCGVALMACAATLGSSDATYFDTTRCYWAAKRDVHGDYEQLYCWNPHFAGFRRLRSNGMLVRRYSDGYAGPHDAVVVPPVTIVPRPPATERAAQPATAPEPDDEPPSAEDAHSHVRSQ